MYIKSYISKNQHVFGDYQINFESDGSPLSPDIAQTKEVSEMVTAKEDGQANHYSFIIGENGSGKTSLLKSIIVEQLCKRNPYGWSDAVNGGAHYIKYVSTPSPAPINSMDFSKIVLCSNNKFLDINKFLYDIYYEYTPNSFTLNETLLNTFILYKSDIKKLTDIIAKKKDTIWKVQIEYLPQRTYQHFSGTKITNPSNVIQILQAFIPLVKQQAKGAGLTNEQQDLYQIIDNINSSKYFHYGWTRYPSMQSFFNTIANSSLFKNLETIYNTYFKKSSEDILANRKYDDRNYSAYEIQDITLEDLTEDDTWLMPLMSQLGVIRYDILLNDVIVDDLSSGEQMMIQLFCNLAPVCNNANHSNILLLFDEPETSLHPRWQQQFPLIFKTVVEDIYGINDSHFIFCTHSPIIIHNAVQLGNSSVLKFAYKNNKFSSKIVNDVNKFCIEQLLIDDFGFEYLPQSKLDEMANMLKEYDAKNVVCDTSTLKSQIEELYNQVMK